MELEVKFTRSAANMAVGFTESADDISADFGETQIVNTGSQVYSGEYTVTPKVYGQMMRTKGKMMADDVTIKEVPVYRVSNNSGGTTVYIAREV